MNSGDPTASLDIVQEGLVEVKEKIGAEAGFLSSCYTHIITGHTTNSFRPQSLWYNGYNQETKNP